MHICICAIMMSNICHAAVIFVWLIWIHVSTKTWFHECGAHSRISGTVELKEMQTEVTTTRRNNLNEVLIWNLVLVSEQEPAALH